ncbi:subtilisin family serine protease, partial [Escherichia coli]|nr:subtilisin family serine protease [Escherichia coli]
MADAYRAKFLQLFEEYLTKLSTKADDNKWSTPEGNPANQALIANIARIRRAVLRDLWTSEGEPPTRGLHWWELWLHTTQPNHEIFGAFAAAHKLRTTQRSVAFRDRIVVWVEATWDQLQILPFTG